MTAPAVSVVGSLNADLVVPVDHLQPAGKPCWRTRREPFRSAAKALTRLLP